MVGHDNHYKQLKEAWVSNCTGGSSHEIASVILTFVASHTLWSCLTRTKSYPQSFLLQFLVYVVPTLCVQTILSNYSLWVNFALLAAARQCWETSCDGNDRRSESNGQMKPYLTVYRAGTMLVTCMAILAVDFSIFPRRFAKVETFGTSLMDVGVGSFVFSSGVVACRSMIFSRLQYSPWQKFMRSFQSSLPLLLLGISRIILTKSVDYQEHVSEYGTHWNFFFTLGCLGPLSTLFLATGYRLPFGYLALTIATVYQLSLDFGLQRWVLEAPRMSIISANKEGLCSIFGYTAIFLFGLDVGMVVFSISTKASKIFQILGIDMPNNTQRVAATLCIRSIVYALLLAAYIVIGNQRGIDGHQVSRRLANISYVLWVVSMNTLMLGSLVLVEYHVNYNGRQPSLLSAVNRHGLLTFLLANVLTGLVNMSVDTLYASPSTAFTICLVYIYVVSIVPYLLAKKTRWTLSSLLGK